MLKPEAINQDQLKSNARVVQRYSNKPEGCIQQNKSRPKKQTFNNKPQTTNNKQQKP